MIHENKYKAFMQALDNIKEKQRVSQRKDIESIKTRNEFLKQMQQGIMGKRPVLSGMT